MVPPRTTERISGATVPARIWAAYSRATLNGLPALEFPAPPSDGVGDLLSVHVPDVVGMPLPQARTILATAGLRVHTTSRVSDQYPPFTVLGQAPASQAEARVGSIVELTVATSE
jgi:hypothetical protein